MKYTVKILILLGVFIASIYFFGSNMDETIFGSVKTEMMAEAELPVIELFSDGVTVNRLCGYTSAIDPYEIRENLIAVESDQTIELLIDENKTDVRKLHYKILNADTREETAEGTINAFDKTEEQKKARIKLSGKKKDGQEYAVELMLVDSESRRIYYYFRVKYFDDSCFAEKVAFMQDFSSWAREKDSDAVIPFLESTYRGEGSTYAKVDIKDSFFMVCWGDLEPKLLTQPQVTISEIYSNVAVGTLDYMVELQTSSGTEQYYVKEKFRVIVTGTSKHLLNYERTMESVFDPALASISQNQFKLGITNDTDLELLTNVEGSMLAFVRNEELWHYNMTENRLTKVFSYRKERETEEGISPEQYDIHILRVYENGDVSFMVYGHMGRGEYEGKTGILLYRYYREAGRVEELLYLPISETYQKMKEELGIVSYINELDVYFFTIYNTIYSYNLITKELSVIAENAGGETIAFFQDSGYVAWQGEQVDVIHLLNLETGEKQEITAVSGEFVRILGQINNNIICGYGYLEDCQIQGDGTMLYPAYEVKILDAGLEERKSYKKDGIYITNAEISENSVCLCRVTKTASGKYQEIEDDYILNSASIKKQSVLLEYRITQLMYQEYYIALPSGLKMEKAPVPESVPHTLITEDTTVRIETLGTDGEAYVVYSFGEIVGSSENCGELIQLANQTEVVGTVLNEEGRVIWERGVKSSSASLKEETGSSIQSTGLSSRQEAVRMMGVYLGVELDGSDVRTEQTVKEVLEEASGVRMISLTGVTLDEALYFVYRGAPVYVMKDQNNAVLITGYTSSHITYYDPTAGKYKTMSLEKAQEQFETAGSLYLSYVK